MSERFIVVGLNATLGKRGRIAPRSLHTGIPSFRFEIKTVAKLREDGGGT